MPVLSAATAASDAPSESSPPGIPIATYILINVVGLVHLKDRLAMQRFVGSLLMAAWPSQLTQVTVPAADLQQRIQTCLTNVTYYDEILGG